MVLTRKRNNIKAGTLTFVGVFFYRKLEDLKKLDFSKVAYTWDCC